MKTTIIRQWIDDSNSLYRYKLTIRDGVIELWESYNGKKWHYVVGGDEFKTQIIRKITYPKVFA